MGEKSGLRGIWFRQVTLYVEVTIINYITAYDVKRKIILIIQKMGGGGGCVCRNCKIKMQDFSLCPSLYQEKGNKFLKIAKSFKKPLANTELKLKIHIKICLASCSE